jgi:hypothetical protein
LLRRWAVCDQPVPPGGSVPRISVTKIATTPNTSAALAH